MHSDHRYVPSATAADCPGGTPDKTAASGLNLFLELADPARLPELLQAIGRRRPEINAALESLHYVHYARFLPAPRLHPTHLIVVTEFDGHPESYILDFAAVLGDAFTEILGFVRNPPPLPVVRHPYAFLDFVKKHNMEINPWSAHGDSTVIELQGARRSLPAAAPVPASTPIDLGDVQGNLFNGYRASHARHFALEITDAALSRAFLAGVVGGDETASPQVTTSLTATPADYFLNIGVTFAGLRALGVPEPTLALFPQAFREGPADAARAHDNGDTGDSAPANWDLGRPDSRVDLLVSLHVKHGAADLESETRRLETLFGQHRLRVVSHHDAHTLPHREVHFGYRDGMGQPRIAGAPSRAGADLQPLAAAGDFLLGAGHLNHFGGNWIGDGVDKLPNALCDNATYAAVRVLRQDVAGFERMLQTEAARHKLCPEFIAAKLMGRWRNGVPLSLSPESSASALPPAQQNAFDYSPSAEHPLVHDDFDGLRCPVGSHVRRMNPRGALVAGKPYSRRIVRRGMPYGPAWAGEAAKPAAAAERGLFGFFLCADLQQQFEFLLRAWANGDRATSGLRGTRDPIIGARQDSGKFLIRSADARDPVQIDVPPLTTTRGGLYLLVPGIGGLKYLSQSPDERRSHDAKWSGTPFDPGAFDPTDPAFRADPYPAYALFRRQAPVARIVRSVKVDGVERGYDAFWVFSHALVTEVCVNERLFLKRPASQAPTGRGLFFMDPPRHGAVRPLMDQLLAAAVAQAPAEAASAATDLLGRAGQDFDFVAAYAKPLPKQIFMSLMGVDEGDRQAVGDHIDAALDGHDPLASPGQLAAAGEAKKFLGAHFGGMLGRCPALQSGPGLVCAMASVATPQPLALTPGELLATAGNMALGGYLSSEFLIATGLYHLLRHPAQWALLRQGTVPAAQAVQEMLRYDAPFQMADRYAAEDTQLGGVTIPKDSLVVVVYGSANRDEAVFGPTAGEFDIRRAPQPHYGLGHGIHRCIGKPLVERVVPLAFEALVRDLPGVALAGGEPTWRGDPYFRSIRQLRVSR